MSPIPTSVAEFQGLYGPFSCPERVLQKIWLRGDFDRAAARTTDGRRVEVLRPGHWNLLGGPDFRGALLRLDGREVHGDIEVHFHTADWRAHSHAANPAFGSVVLHVLLFPPEPAEPPALRGDGTELPALVLLPLLLRDLEEHVSDDALETLTSRDEWRMLAELANRPPAELPPLLRAHAEGRWRQKLRFARLRLDRLGWSAAAHHVALEILGFRHNRAPMLALAARWPLERWAAGVDPAELFATDALNWNLQGLRPANHPRARLQQYAAIVRAQPAWPDRLIEWGETLPRDHQPRPPPDTGHLKARRDVTLHHPPSPSLGTREARRQLDLPRLRESLANGVLGGSLSGTRLDNLACDGLLPLLTAHTGRDAFAPWFHWFLGDAPDQVKRALPQLGIGGTRDQPVCHGFGQGLLGWLLERELRASGWRSEP